jgi:hypothetical protein
MSTSLTKILEDSKNAMKGNGCLAEFNDFRGREDEACRACQHVLAFNCRTWKNLPIIGPTIGALIT